MFIVRYLFLFLVLLIVGCGSTPPQATRVPKVRIQWLGHNCFQITSSLGITLLTDPFDPKLLPYPVPSGLQSDIVTVSHESPATNHIDLVENSPQVIRSRMGVGSNRAYGLLIRGVDVSTKNAPTGRDVAFTWDMDGVRFCHLGAIQQALTMEQARALGRPDVLFLPVGSPPELTDSARDKILQLLQPRIVVPMGYGTRRTARIDAGKPSRWLAAQENAQSLPVSNFSVTRENLPFTRAVLVPAIP